MDQKEKKNNLLARYAGLTMQLLVSLGVAMYAGNWLDRQVGWGLPLLIWISPLLVIMVTLYQMIRDTSNKD